MKTDHRWLKPILCFAMLVLLVSCATYIPTDNSVGNMSVKQARNVLATKLMNNKPYEYKDVRVTSKRLFVTAPEGKQSVFIFRELPQISQGGASELDIWFADRVEFLIFGNPRAFVNALYVLKQNAIRQKKASDEFDASFAASLADYRKMAASNAALPEEANKYKVQAEGAVRDKEFDDAADLYAAALKIAPWWPVGHFNRALVLGETGEYGEAMREMKHYLQLVPDAPNARAAQDKIYDWERLESKAETLPASQPLTPTRRGGY